MIHFKYSKGWDKQLLTDLNAANRITCEIENVYSIDRGKRTETVKKLIEKAVQCYDKEDCLFGLFSALGQARHRISAFTATHSYSLTILSCSPEGLVRMNISPIYLLGPEYLEQHQQRFGSEIDAEAVIQLFHAEMNGDSENQQRPFSVGIDAGIVFKNSLISHNKMLRLQFEFLNEGVISSLSCENQTTSMKISCDNHALTTNPLLQSQPEKKRKRIWG